MEFVEKEKADEESDSDDTDSGNCDGDLGDDDYPYLHLAFFIHIQNDEYAKILII